MVAVERDEQSDRTLLGTLLEKLGNRGGRSEAFPVFREVFEQELGLELRAIGLGDRIDRLSVHPREGSAPEDPPTVERLLTDGSIQSGDGLWYPIVDHVGFVGVFFLSGDSPDDSSLRVLDGVGPPILSYFRRLVHYESASVREELVPPGDGFWPNAGTRFEGQDEIFRSAVQSISRIFQCDNCRLFWLESPDILQLKAEDPSSGDRETELVVSNDPVIDQVINEGKSVLINDMPESEDSLREFSNIRSFLSVPIKYDGQVRGAINLSSSTPDVYTKDDLQRFTAFCEHLSTVFASTRELVDLTHYVDKVMSNLPVGVLTYRIRSDDVHFNREARNILGVDSTSLDREAFEESMRSRMPDQGFLELLDIDEALDDLPPQRYELSDPDAESPRIIKAYRNSIRDSEDLLGGILIVVSEITEQVRLNEQVNRAERLAALGELASSLAHEIKNPLTSIQGFVQMLPDRAGDVEYIEKTAEILRKECARLDELIENLHSYAKPQVGQRQQFSLETLVDETVTLLGKEAEKSDVDVEVEVPEDLQVYGDASKLKQVVMNLSLNAIEAMPDGGELSLVAELNRSGDCRLIIGDTGVGMDDDQLEKIFNPFYTTKEEGTGLGMAISHRIVQDHGGIMNIDSTPGEGTTVEVLLPTSDANSPRGRNSFVEQK